MSVASASVPRSVSETIQRLANAWLDSPDRPRVQHDIGAHWDSLLERWIDDETAPLLVRKGGSRGSIVPHASGRSLVPVDNAPANWVLSSALAGRTPTLRDVLDALSAGHLPVGLALKKSERQSAVFKGTQRVQMNPPNLNTLGWKVCHIDSVGLGASQPLGEVPIAMLEEHVRRFLSVGNMFLVPKTHAGLGELPEFLERFRAAKGAESLPAS